MSNSALFKPFSCRGLTIPNRVVMAPMTRSFSPGGVPGEDVAAYYARRARADVGLIVTEGTTVNRGGASNDPKVPNFHDVDALKGWENIVKAVHAENGKIAPQLWHVGMMRKPGTGPNPDAISDSPSGLSHTGKAVMPAPSESEVADMIKAYVDAAVESDRLGFDAIEIHGAHGYLIDQFFWNVMNQREDKYGGDLIERTRFAADIIKEIRAKISQDTPIILRWSQWKQQDFGSKLAETPDMLESFVGVLADAGVDIFHCSTRRYWEPEFDGSDLNLAGWVKKVSGKPTITVGSVGLASDFIGTIAKGEGSKRHALDDIETRLEKGEFDLVAVGRALLQDPEWAQKVKEGRTDELKDFDRASMDTLY